MHHILLLALMTWIGLPAKDPGAWEREHFERTDAAEMRLVSIADDLVATGAEPRVQLELAAVAFEESGLQRYVDDGTCNLSGPIRALHRLELAHGTCDGGRAFTIFQMWTDVGVGRRQGEGWLADRASAAYRARVLWESRPQQWTTWKRAKARAAAWEAGHPLEASLASSQ